MIKIIKFILHTTPTSTRLGISSKYINKSINLTAILCMTTANNISTFYYQIKS